MPVPALLLGLAVAAPPAQEPAAPAGCRHCDHRGVVDCPAHEEDLLALEQEVLFCSAAARCPDCGGALAVPCARCEGGPETAATAARREEAAAWLAREDPLEAFLGRPLVRIETEHFRFVTDAEGLKRGKKRIDGHRFLHELAHDAERAAALLDGHYRPGPKDYRARMRLWFWNDRATHREVMRCFLHSGAEGDFKMLGHEPLFSVWCFDPSFQGDEPSLRSLGVHNGIHMLLSNLFAEIWIGDQGAGWLDSGAAHWYEEKVFAQVRHYCIDEAAVPPNWNGGVWRAAVRERLGRRDDPMVLPTLLTRQTGAMTPEEMALAWSFYDWLVATVPETLADFLRGAKQREGGRELVKRLLGLDLIQAERTWRAWVAETYPAREKKPRRH